MRFHVLSRERSPTEFVPEDFALADHRLREFRVEAYCGLLFGTFDTATPALEAYLGDRIAGFIGRVMRKPARVL